MSLEKVVAIIAAKGIEGIKKAELRRELPEVQELDSILQELVRTQEIFIERKGNSFYCWHKNYYLQKLLSTDQKFSLLYSLMNSMQDSLNARFDSFNAGLNAVTTEVSAIADGIRALAGPGQRDTSANDLALQEQIEPINIDYDRFKEQLDHALASSSSSIGWVELCNVQKISAQR